MKTTVGEAEPLLRMKDVLTADSVPRKSVACTSICVKSRINSYIDIYQIQAIIHGVGIGDRGSSAEVCCLHSDLLQVHGILSKGNKVQCLSQ